MDVEAIAKRIAQDHGVTVLEKDVIETLEKLKAANEKKNTPPVTSATTDAATNPEHAASVPAHVTEHVKPPETEPAHVTEQHTGGSASVKTQVKDDSAPLKAQVTPPQNEASKLIIPEGVKPMPIDVIDDLIRQNYTRDGIESILKASKLTVNRKLITERIKVVRVEPLGAQHQTPPLGASHVTSASSDANPPITSASSDAATPSVKTPENTGNSGQVGPNGVALVPAHVTEQQVGGAASVTSNAASTPHTIPPPIASVNAQLPADLSSILAAFQQFLASRQQPNPQIRPQIEHK
jgi:hypothetical protein